MGRDRRSRQGRRRVVQVHRTRKQNGRCLFPHVAHKPRVDRNAQRDDDSGGAPGNSKRLRESALGRQRQLPLERACLGLLRHHRRVGAQEAGGNACGRRRRRCLFRQFERRRNVRGGDFDAAQGLGPGARGRRQHAENLIHAADVRLRFGGGPDPRALRQDLQRRPLQGPLVLLGRKAAHDLLAREAQSERPDRREDHGIFHVARYQPPPVRGRHPRSGRKRQAGRAGRNAAGNYRQLHSLELDRGHPADRQQGRRRERRGGRGRHRPELVRGDALHRDEQPDVQGFRAPLHAFYRRF